MFAVFRNRNFTLLWVAGLISMIGDWTLGIGIPVYVYRMTGSTLATGALLVVRTVPGLVFGSVAGVFADRWDRRRTMVAANVLMALCLLPLLLVQSLEHLPIVYVVLFVQGALAQFFVPAERALLPLLVDEEDLPTANTLNALNGNLARLLGPSLGGLVIAVGSLSTIAIIDVVSFLLAAGLIVLMVYERRAAVVEVARTSILSTWGSVQREWHEGFAYVKRTPALARLLVIVGITAIGEGFIGTLIVPFVTDVMHGTESDYGYLMASQAVGGILGSLLIARIAKRVSPRKLLAVCAIIFGVLDLVLFYYPLWISGVGLGMVLIALVGIPVIGFLTGFMTLMQTLSLDAYRGRVFGMYGALSALLLLIGAVLSGVLGQSVSIVALLTVQGAGFILAGVLAFVMLGRDVEPTYQREQALAAEAE